MTVLEAEFLNAFWQVIWPDIRDCRVSDVDLNNRIGRLYEKLRELGLFYA
jgi:hypothetical protein